MSLTGRRNWWPVGIALALTGFAGGLATLITFALSSNSDLVMRDYYEQEIRYQDQIERKQRTQPLSAEVEVTHDALLGKILIRLPADHAVRGANGEVHLYRPSAEGLDRRYPLALNAAGMQVIEASDLASGLWRVKIQWKVGEEEFFEETRLVIRAKGS
jgi:nitrogen fixation protein FixH